jgi:CHAT domain-containing protein
MPLHAAPLPTGEALFERFVPSYTATLRALLTSREPGEATSNGLPFVVGVARSADGSDRLPGACTEVGIVASRLVNASVLRDDQAARAAVLDDVAQRAWFHFAGHAEQRGWQDGGLVLRGWDGPLAAAEIAAVSPAHAEIAVLPACETAFGDVEL